MLFKLALLRLGFSGRLNTAFIERVNLTVRHGISALARRVRRPILNSLHTCSPIWSGGEPIIIFVRPHASLRVALAQPREREGKLAAQR